MPFMISKTKSGSISHDSILDVSADDHHNESHTLASHSTKAHTELTGVTSDQHHAQSHNAASHSDIASTGANIDLAVTHKDADGSSHADVVTNSAKISYTDAADVTANTTHRSSNGSDHSKVGANETAIALNTTHRGSNGSDHSKVTANETAIALNTTHRGDNTQAHSDYLINNGNDSTTGRLSDHTGFITPVGTIVMYGGATAPTGWLLCNGAAVSRTTTYNHLFAVISTTFGVGNGSTTFNVPDMRGAFPRGAGTSTKFTQDHTTTLGACEDDSFQKFKLDVDANVNYGLRYGTYGASSSGAWTANTAVGGIYGDTFLASGANGIPRTANETRPNNLGLTFIIKY